MLDELLKSRWTRCAGRPHDFSTTDVINCRRRLTRRRFVWPDRGGAQTTCHLCKLRSTVSGKPESETLGLSSFAKTVQSNGALNYASQNFSTRQRRCLLNCSKFSGGVHCPDMVRAEGCAWIVRVRASEDREVFAASTSRIKQSVSPRDPKDVLGTDR